MTLFAVVIVLGCSTTDPLALNDGFGAERHFTFSWERPENGFVEPEEYANVRNLLDGDKPMLALYREDLTHDAVEDFFVSVAGSPEIALPILYHAERSDLSLSLVFALAYVESGFSAVAVNVNQGSADRGLFQLNSRTFRSLSEEDFFHPDVNAYYGTEYLEWCVTHTQSERWALVAYNAGLSRARRGEIPQSTRIYISRIMAYRENLMERFNRFMLERFPSQTV